MDKKDKKRADYIMWLIGHAIITAIGILIYQDYGFTPAVAVGYGLFLLLDIRREVSKID